MASGVQEKHAVALQMVIMPGADQLELPLLQTAAQGYGWSIQHAFSAAEVKNIREDGKIGAVLFQEDSLGSGGSWLETISELKEAAPDARLIACMHFSDDADYPKLCRAGLFHAMWLPLMEHEVRQCLGFIWEAEKRLSLVMRPGQAVRVRVAG